MGGNGPEMNEIPKIGQIQAKYRPNTGISKMDLKRERKEHESESKMD